MKPGVFQTFCQNCHMKCRIFVTVQDGRVKNISNAGNVEGEKAAPAYEEVIHPDRVIHPLKRMGRRGEGKWEAISWDEALDTMAEKFTGIKEAHGAEAVASLRG